MVAKAQKALKDIVKDRMDALNISILELSRQTGIPSARMYKWYKDDTNPKFEDAQTLQEWLNSKSNLEEVPRETLGPSYIEQRRFGKINGEDFFVPLVPYKARAGYSRNYDQVDYVGELETYQIPPGVKWRGSEWRWFEVGGDSMQPVLYDQDYLLCSLIPEADWLDIEAFKIHVVVWKNDVSVKRVAVDKGDFVLISENEKENPQIRVRLNDVKEVWKVRRQLNAKLPPTKEFKIRV